MIQTKQSGRHKLASISELEILRIQDDAVLQNTKRATTYLAWKFSKVREEFILLPTSVKQSSRQKFVSLRVILFCRAGHLAKFVTEIRESTHFTEMTRQFGQNEFIDQGYNTEPITGQ